MSSFDLRSSWFEIVRSLVSGMIQAVSLVAAALLGIARREVHGQWVFQLGIFIAGAVPLYFSARHIYCRCCACFSFGSACSFHFLCLCSHTIFARRLEVQTLSWLQSFVGRAGAFFNPRSLHPDLAESACTCSPAGLGHVIASIGAAESGMAPLASKWMLTGFARMMISITLDSSGRVFIVSVILFGLMILVAAQVHSLQITMMVWITNSIAALVMIHTVMLITCLAVKFIKTFLMNLIAVNALSHDPVALSTKFCDNTFT